jgi:hypothetical protein
VRLTDELAGVGTAHSGVPARSPEGRPGWGAGGERGLPAELEDVRNDVVTVSPRTDLAGALGRAFAARARRRCA